MHAGHKDRTLEREGGELAAPARLGYAMPPEWEPHDATWIAWPHRQEEWPGKYEPIPWTFVEIVRILAQGGRVHIFVEPSRGKRGGRVAREVREMLQRGDVNVAHVTLHEQPTDRIWTRDSGPIFVRRKAGKAGDRGTLAVVDFKFNAWARYEDSAHDDALPEAVARLVKLPRFVAFGENDRGELQRFVLEGGAIDVNGAGCVLATEECLLSKVQERNPGFSRERVERVLEDYLGVKKVIWLAGGVVGDDTHGHVDDVARFVNETTIVTCAERDRGDANYRALAENRSRLRRARDVRGRPFEVVELPMPEPVYFNGKRLPASYANFYLANSAVLVPVFNDVNDGTALRILEQCFKGRDVVGVYCRDLVLGRGAIHCMTQQQPEEGAA
jgi:agmatine deiminase